MMPTKNRLTEAPGASISTNDLHPYCNSGLLEDYIFPAFSKHF